MPSGRQSRVSLCVSGDARLFSCHVVHIGAVSYMWECAGDRVPAAPAFWRKRVVYTQKSERSIVDIEKVAPSAEFLTVCLPRGLNF